MDAIKLKEVLELHVKWINGEEGGVRADLSYANLSCANLRGANLRGADLRVKSLWSATGNRLEVKSISISEKYAVTYTAEVLQIGCKIHKIEEWWTFSDEEISKMDADALPWWNENKDFIRMTLEKYPAVKSEYKGK